MIFFLGVAFTLKSAQTRGFLECESSLINRLYMHHMHHLLVKAKDWQAEASLIENPAQFATHMYTWAHHVIFFCF